jgi:ATP-dependent DNA helicase
MNIDSLNGIKDEELKKQLADEVENQNKSGHLDMSTTEDIKLSREGRKWNGKKIPPEQPLLISGGIMKPYQIEGMIWMANLRKAGANGILADEMGLGKTLQTISLFCLLSEVDKNAGPFLVIAPLSTLLNWKREIERFAPGVPAKLLYPKQKAVEEWDYLEDRHPSPLGKDKTLGTIYITSYETAISIRSMLKEVNWTYICVDEGHRLKNKDCRLSVELKKINSKNRLLLTGTPLQNDLEELCALLSYLQPSLFNHHELFSDYYDAKKLHTM